MSDYPAAVSILGAADAMRERTGYPRLPGQQANIAEPVATTHDALTDHAWDDAYRAGRNITVEDALTQAHAARPKQGND